MADERKGAEAATDAGGAGRAGGAVVAGAGGAAETVGVDSGSTVKGRVSTFAGTAVDGRGWIGGLG